MKTMLPSEVDIARRKVLRNAVALLREARLLMRHRRYARAYALAHLASEEMSKIPMLVRAGLEAQTDPAFDWRAVAKRLQSHKAKLRGAAVWDYLLDPEIDGDVDLRRLADQLGGIDASNDLKNQSLYSGVVKDAFVSPHESISPEIARGMLDRSTVRLSAVLVFERATLGAVSAVTPESLQSIEELVEVLSGRRRTRGSA